MDRHRQRRHRHLQIMIMATRTDFAHCIGKCAIDHYIHTLPSNNGGKPQSGREWTVYAAIVACRVPTKNETSDAPCEHDVGDRSDQRPEMWVVSCATGSKCTSIRSTVSSLPSPKSSPANNGHGACSRSHGNGKMTNGKRRKPISDTDEPSICQ